MTRSDQTREFVREAVIKLHENTPRIEKCFSKLTDEEVWRKPNNSSNSVANLILHLCGNMTQYIISGLGGKPDFRERDLEFSIQEGYSKAELIEKLKSTVSACARIIESQNDANLLKHRVVQGFDYSGYGIIIHVVEHYSYHTGQIAFWTKLLKDRDLGFYAGLDLNVKNKLGSKS